jgi:transcriptional regulator with XRE-family HTH domain
MARHRTDQTAIPAAVLDEITRLGRSIAAARQRRRWRQDDLAAKAGVNPNTIRKVEAGAPGTGVGAYAAALWALGLGGQLGDVARPDRDAEGQALAEARLGKRTRLSTAGLDDDF